ncbi:MAG: hypothetical protein ACRC5H_01870 [Treponemataceae bacterium]
MPLNGLVQPSRNTSVPYVCKKCGHRFSAKKPLFPLSVKCPKCGGSCTAVPVCW